MCIFISFHQLVIGEDDYDIIGVFDGHNGPAVSKFISENIGDVIKEIWIDGIDDKCETEIYKALFIEVSS